VSLQIERWSEEKKPDAADLRRRLESEGYTVFEWTDGPGTFYGPHKHSDDQSHWIISGSLKLAVGDTTYTLAPGDRDYLPANTIHSAFVVGTEPVRYLIGAKRL
jgi:quercetin dioxygenase-like cupin family protein